MADIRKGVANVNKKQYGVVAIVALMYCSVAAGAFGIEEMVSTCGPGLAIIALLGMIFVWAIPDCFCVTEVGSVLPAEGGDIFWAKHTLGEFYSFQEGIWYAISYYACSGTYIVLATNYLGYFFEWNNAEAFIVKLIIVLAFTVVNLMGLKEVSVLSIAFSIFILLVFAFITVVGFGNWNYNPIEPIFNDEEGFSSSLGQALAIGVWMYCGWAMINQLSGEVTNKMVIPKSILIVCPLIGLSYLLPTIAGVASVGRWDMWTTDLSGDGVGYITVLTENVGGWCGVLVVLTAFIGNLAIFNTNMACGSRSLFVVADDNLAPACFTWLTKRSGVPSIGILSMSLVTILLMQMEFTTLILIQVIPEFACAFCLAVMVFKARKLYPEETRRPDAYRIPGGKAGTLYCTISICCVSVAAFFLNGLDYFLYGVFLILSGVVLYVICKWIWGGPWKKNPDKWPLNPRTKLAYGDTFRIAILLEIMAAVCLAGRVFLNIIEGSWGPEYYLEEYGSGLLSDFYGMLNLLLVMGIILAIIGAVLILVGKKVDKYIPQPVILSEEDRLEAMSGSAGEAF